ncbi:histidine phosphatase family protein [Corynebacterium epidermidicanis]|uniref:Fructose-2,6-bisphosphatase n=1 Tax=Corynebacterium epidermidicanis TaxID=1050174 RepID=A0A0G3GRM0_9CORY|nr:histidine phosphatase family protein [Corynebacterium epidermidicanis]AKK03769.1 fructose-2,6-bisphosphatase [Corynebacterium epidermidicanis]
MTRRLILLRHGETFYNATRRMQGHMDTELSEVGIAQAEQAAQHLQGLNITTIVSSDLQRARITAQSVADKIGAEVRIDSRLRETDLGEWQGMSHEEVDAQYPGARALWRHDATWAPPRGESRVAVAARARAVIDELMLSLDNWDDTTVLVVAHGGTIAALTSALLRLDVQQYPMLSGLKNTCWAQLTARPRYYPGSPDADGEGDPVLPQARFTPETVGDAQWYLDGWNVSAR